MLVGRTAALSAVLAALSCWLRPAEASTRPHVLVVSSLHTARVTSRAGAFYSFGAVVRFDGQLRNSERGALGLIGFSPAAANSSRAGRPVPERLVGGTSLGRIGDTGRHCYVAEVALVRRRHTVRLGSSWLVALHDGRRIVRSGRRVELPHARPKSRQQQAREIGCAR